MKPTQQETIELAREAGITTVHNGYHPVSAFTADQLECFAALLLERFGAGGWEPTGYLVGHSGEYHYFRHKADAEREKAEQERCSGESCGDVEPVFRRPSPTDLRAEYLRGLEDAAKVARSGYDTFWQRHEPEFPKAKYDQASVLRTLHSTVEFVSTDIADAIEALKGK